MLEYIKRFLKRAHSSDQIKSSTFVSLQFYIFWGVQVVEVLHYVSQKSNSFPFFIISQKAENTLAFLHILLTSREKNKISFPKDQISAKLFLYSNIFHDCALVNLYTSFVFSKKRFHRYFLALNSLFSPV